MKIFIYASILAVVLCREFRQLPEDKTCPDLELKVLNDVYCQKGEKTHCLMDDQHRHGVVCVKERDIQAGYCPYYNNAKSAMEVRPCEGERCPNKTFTSSAVVLYPECYENYRGKLEDEL
uniref:Uncharacterized protein LOC111134619 isoform X3 n=1 Tax=Crassostrea virginica TaxID=6565 RepID=A0A8B8EHF5_CRAVI|nr:uncharacterized protein LOC111134619 isoform X3 [Crassostrea virginica]